MTENRPASPVKEGRDKATDPLEQKIIDLFQDNPGMVPFKDPRERGVFRARRGDVSIGREIPADQRALVVEIWSNPVRLGLCEINIGEQTGEASGKVRTIQAQRKSYGKLHDLVLRDSTTTVEVFEDTEREGSGRREENMVREWKTITDENIDDVLALLQSEGIDPFVQQAPSTGKTDSTEE